MNNFFKRILAAVLALAMALGCMTVSFAADETIDWYFNGPGEEESLWRSIPYCGDIVAGNNEIGKELAFEDEINVMCYGFTAETEGFYRFSLTDLNYMFNNGIGFSEYYVGGKAYGFADELLCQRKDEGIDFVYYLPAGEKIMYLQCVEEMTLTYEFLGAEITDIAFDENSLTGILGSDFLTEKNASYVYGIDAEAVFDSGKTYKIEDKSFDLDVRLEKGENIVTLELFGFEKEVTLNAVEFRDVIAKLEAINLEDDLVVTEHYNGYISANDIVEATIKITYADGRKENVDIEGSYSMITLPNGRNYFVGVRFIRETLTAELAFEGEVYETYDLEIKPASFEENIAELNSENAIWLEQAEEDMNWRINNLAFADGFMEKVSLVFWIPFLYTNAFYQIFCNVVEFVEYYV